MKRIEEQLNSKFYDWKLFLFSQNEVTNIPQQMLSIILFHLFLLFLKFFVCEKCGIPTKWGHSRPPTIAHRRPLQPLPSLRQVLYVWKVWNFPLSLFTFHLDNFNFIKNIPIFGVIIWCYYIWKYWQDKCPPS